MSATPIPKGTRGAACNRTSCQRPASAFWYNRSTRKYYCEYCATRINRLNPSGTIGRGIEGGNNPLDSYAPGEPLCVNTNDTEERDV
jgi:hypothetical protein